MPDERNYNNDGYTAPRRRYREDSSIPRTGENDRGAYGAGADSGNTYNSNSSSGYSQTQSGYSRRYPQQGYQQEQQSARPRQGYDSHYDEYDSYPTREANYERGAARGRGYRDRQDTSSYRNPYLYDDEPQQTDGSARGYDRRNGYGQTGAGYQNARRQNTTQYAGGDPGYDNPRRQDARYQQQQDDIYDARGDYRAENNAPRARQAQQRSRSSAPSGFFNELWERLGDTEDQRKVRLLLIGSVALVLIGVVLCICLQTCSSCGSGCAGSDIPVVEQGDGEEELYSSEIETVSISDGAVTIDQQAGAVDEFAVSVTNADGTYQRTNVKKSDAATLSITEQNDTGFFFTLNVNGGELTGYAYFNGADTAAYELAEGLIGFTFEGGAVKIYHTIQIAEFGGMSADGEYITGTPVYTEETSAASAYDADIRTTDAVTSALKSLMSSEDYELMNTIFSSGTCPTYQNDELTVDKNGKEVMVDSEMKAVKYYGFISGAGSELVLICSNSGKVYIGICDGGEYRYYTNDDSYKSNAPSSISGQAAVKDMQLKYC